MSDRDATLTPEAATDLVGRERDLATLIELLQRPTPRLVTLAGAGGSGKTRLALEVARLMSAQYRDGAIFISLADVADPRHVASEVARALGFVDLPGQHPTDRLVEGLRGQHVLLVLDNLEHLTAAAPLFDEVLARCPEIRLLTTSRRRLGGRVEHVIDVGGLTLPAINQTDSEELRAVPSVQLFLRRAAAVSQSFEPDDAQLRSIAELCRMLDGLPLGIELVASYSTVLSTDALLARVSQRSGSLAISDALRWSYDLLTHPAADLLPQLATFHDGWSLDAMEAVCRIGDVDDPSSGLLDALVELIDLHLVEPISRPDGELRFRLLETVRRFALHRLEADAAAHELARARHAAYFRDIAIRLGAEFDSPSAPRAIAELDRELANIRASLEQLERTERWTEGLEAIVALCAYWLDYGPISETRAWLRRFLPHVSHGGVLFAIADAYDARMTFAASLDLPDGADADPHAAVDAVEARLVRAQATLAEAGEWWHWWRVAFFRLIVRHFGGRFDEIDSMVDEMLQQRPWADDTRWVRAEFLSFFGQSLRERDQRDAALSVTEQTIELARAVRHERILGQALTTLASFSTDAPGPARAELEPVFSIAIDIGDRRGATVTAGMCGLLALLEGDTRGAVTWFRRGVDLGLRMGWSTGVARGLAGVVAVAAMEGRWVEAARMHGAFRTHGEKMRRGMPPSAVALYDAVCDRVAEQLDDQFEIECQRGVEAGWDAAIDLARRLATELGRDDHAEDVRRPRRRGPRANPELTDRELDVLSELVVGRTNVEIGDQLGISPKTVMHHTMNVYRKLGVRGRAEAVAHALRTGLVNA